MKNKLIWALMIALFMPMMAYSATITMSNGQKIECKGKTPEQVAADIIQRTQGKMYCGCSGGCVNVDQISTITPRVTTLPPPYIILIGLVLIAIAIFILSLIVARKRWPSTLK